MTQKALFIATEVKICQSYFYVRCTQYTLRGYGWEFLVADFMPITASHIAETVADVAMQLLKHLALDKKQLVFNSEAVALRRYVRF